MSLEHEEQESVEALKVFWKTHGNKLTALVLATALVVAAVKGWTYWQYETSLNAASVFQALRKAADSGQQDNVDRAWESLRNEHGQTTFAVLGGLVAAYIYAEDDKFDQAVEALKWTIDNADDQSIRETAMLRQATILIDANQLDKAIKSIENVKSVTLLTAANEKRGDIYSLLGERGKARDAYLAALQTKHYQGTSEKNLIIKFVAVGGKQG